MSAKLGTDHRKLVPLRDRLLVRMNEQVVPTTETGIQMTTEAHLRPSQTGVIQGLGPKVEDVGNLKVGAMVYFAQMAGHEVPDQALNEKRPLIFLKEADIEGVYENHDS